MLLTAVVTIGLGSAPPSINSVLGQASCANTSADGLGASIVVSWPPALLEALSFFPCTSYDLSARSSRLQNDELDNLTKYHISQRETGTTRIPAGSDTKALFCFDQEKVNPLSRIFAHWKHTKRRGSRVAFLTPGFPTPITMDQHDFETNIRAGIAKGNIRGAVLCATDSSRRFTYQKAVGERILLTGQHRPQQLDDFLYLASATKLITTIAALQCVDRGLLSLDDDLGTIAPELASREVLVGFSEDGDTPLLEPLASPITLQTLLSHSSGLCYDFLDPLTRKWNEKFNPSRPGVRRTVEEAFKQPLRFQPGTSWMYGPGLDWAGRIVERITGLTLGEHMKKHIFDPLGITDHHFYPVTREDLRERLVDLNPQDPDGLGRAVLGGGDGGNLHSSGDFGGQGLFMTGPDYLKVLHSILENDGRLLSPSTVDNMFRQQLSPEAAVGHEAALNSPAGIFYRVGLDQGTKAGYGLGGLLMLEDAKDWYGNPTLTWGGGLTFTWFIDRKNDLCGVCGIQAALPVENALVEDLKNSFRRGIYRKRTSQASEL